MSQNVKVYRTLEFYAEGGGARMASFDCDDSSTILYLRPETDDTESFNIGDGTTDMDVKIFLGATGDYALFDVGSKQLNITIATVANDGRALKVLTTSATPAMSDGYGVVEIDCTISGTATAWFSPLSSWVNITGSGVAGTGGFICAQQNGVYADAGANTSSTIIFGMRASALLTDAPGRLCPFSLNTSNRSIDAIFDIASGPSAGLVNGTPTGSADGSIPLVIDGGGTIRYVHVYGNRS